MEFAGTPVWFLAGLPVQAEGLKTHALLWQPRLANGSFSTSFQLNRGRLYLQVSLGLQQKTKPQTNRRFRGLTNRAHILWAVLGLIWKKRTLGATRTKSLGVPSPFFPGILLSRNQWKTIESGRSLERTKVEKNGQGINP